MRIRQWLPLLLILASFFPARAWRVSDSAFELGFRGGWIMPGYIDDVMHLMQAPDSHPAQSHAAASLHARWSFAFNAGSPERAFCPGLRQGAGISLNYLGAPDKVGLPVNLYLFQGAPFGHLGGASLGYEWNFGASIGWKPTDPVHPASRVMSGSRCNAYINLGCIARWAIGRDMQIGAGVEFTHYSDGNTSFPNPGVNIIGMRVDLMLPHRVEADCSRQIAPPAGTSRRFSLDLSGYGAWRRRVYRGGKEPLLLDGSFGVAGLSVAPMIEISRFFRTGLSLDSQWDASTDQKRRWISGASASDIRFRAASFIRQTTLGLSARAELMMPLFAVNVGIGVTLAGPPETRGTYQTITLKTFLTRNLYINTGYRLADFNRQNNLMLGMGYTFRL